MFQNYAHHVLNVSTRQSVGMRIAKAIEESAEFTAALAEAMTKPEKDGNYEKIVEEFADSIVTGMSVVYHLKGGELLQEKIQEKIEKMHKYLMKAEVNQDYVPATGKECLNLFGGN
jgi:GTP-sensing pleiotropic transcriptional regulator CodY